jgi:hypothetical protein
MRQAMAPRFATRTLVNTRPLWHRRRDVAHGLLPVRMDLQTMKGDENSHRPITKLITNRPPDAIRPHLRFSQVFDRATPILIPAFRDARLSA